jgi:type I restriction enzyme S subunit
MNKIEQMLQELCPNGVEYKKLGEVCDFVNGFAFKSSLFREKGDRIIRITNIDGTNVNIDDVKYFWKTDYKNDLQPFLIKGGDILIAMSGATTGKIGYYNYEVDSYLNQRVGKFVPIKDKLSTRFLYHILRNKTEYLYVLAGGGAQPNLSSTKLMDSLEIPVPPLPIQEEIVRILDHFTELTAELQAELQARQEQYEYYRNKLLTFDEESVTWMKMSEICNLQRGKVYSKEYLRDNQGIYSVYSSQTINNGELGRISTYDFDGTYLTWTTDGAYAGTIFKRKGKFSITNVCGIISMKSDLVTMDFLYYWLSLKAKEYVYSGMGNPKLMSNQVEKILVPIPALSEQQRIVSILDKFETLVNDLSQGLPAEIAAVQEQYEYYRNKLLTFNRIKLI